MKFSRISVVLSVLMLCSVGTLLGEGCGGSSAVCKRDTDCPRNKHCREDVQLCDFVCEEDSDCGDGFTCSRRRECVKKTVEAEPICADGECHGGDASTGNDEPTKTCNSGDTQACYTGGPGTQDVGVCQAGKRTCVDGTWGACVGEIIPKGEECNNIDDDCNGQVDDREGCQKCTQDQDCPPERSSCRAGVCILLCKDDSICVDQERCLQGFCQPCLDGGRRSSKEVCNGKDDDCDGVVDNGLAPRSCYNGPAGTAGVGRCKAGTQACKGGVWGACTDEVKPATETCNGKDDDCDGSIDEIPSQSCYGGPSGTAGKGVCRQGTRSCRNAQWTSCVGEVRPSTESCNTKDDDCDGSIDEGCSCVDGKTRSCGTNTGLCRTGTQTCRGGQWGSCVGEIKPKTEICEGSVDEDCDGQVDEGCSCVDRKTRTCGKNTGECKTGTETCQGGQWGSCVGEVKPATEICNGKDDNCDGKIDETYPGKGQLCNTPASTSCWAKKINVCEQGVKRCGLPNVRSQSFRPRKDLTFSSDSKTIVFIRDWDSPAHRAATTPVTGSSTSSLPYHSAKKSLYTVVMRNDNKYIWSCLYSDGVVGWSKTSSSWKEEAWGGSGCRFVALNKANTILVSVGRTTAEVWDVATKTVKKKITFKTTEYPNDQAINEAGTIMYTVSTDGYVRKWDLATGTLSASWQAHTKAYDVALSKDGKLLATGSSSSEVKIWDTATQKTLKSFYASRTKMAFSPDGKVLAVSGGSARLYDVATGKQINSISLNKESNDSVVFSPDGKYLMTSSSSTVHYGEYMQVWTCP